MNLRILKKLCKRVAPVLPSVGIDTEQFLAEGGGNYHGFHGAWERKALLRQSARYPFEKDRKFMPRHGKCWVILEYPYCPLKGTPMVGSMQGYYEPEWEEACTWAAFTDLVWSAFTDWESGPRDEHGIPDPIPPRKRFRTTRDYLAAVPEMVARHQEWRAKYRRAAAA